MNVYIWLYVLGAGGVIALGLFLTSFNRDSILLKKLNLKRTNIWVNWLLLAISIASFILTLYLFFIIQHQLELFTM